MTIARFIFVFIYSGLLIMVLGAFEAAGALGLGQVVMWVCAVPLALLIGRWV
jgi:hypothetical protein